MTSPPSRAADPSRGRTAKVTVDGIYLESTCTLLELSNDVKILLKTTENTLQYSQEFVNLHIKSPMHVGHTTVSNLLWEYRLIGTPLLTLLCNESLLSIKRTHTPICCQKMSTV